MIPTDWIYPALLMAGALAAALLLVGLQALSIHVERRHFHLTLAVVPAIMILGMAMGTLMSGRSLAFAETSIGSIYTAAGRGASIQRLLTAAVLALCLAKIFNVMWARRPASGEAQPLVILLALITYFACSTLVAPLLGGGFTLVHNSFYPLAIFIAVFMTRRMGGPEAFLDGVRAALVVLMLGNLALAAAAPDMALQHTTGVTIPGVKVRLWGLEAHPNGVGASALFLLVVLYHRPFAKRWLNVAAAGLAGACLVLAQSKTIWVIALVVAMILAYFSIGRDSKGRTKPWFVLLMLAAGLVVCAALIYIDVERALLATLGSRGFAKLETATGRVEIWRAAIEMWLHDPWFGFGPDAWGPVQRLRLGMPFALHAHNQVLQLLSTSGVLGAVSFGIYFILMLVGSVRASHVTRGTSVAMLAMLAMRSLTEIPLSFGGLFAGDMLIHLGWFSLVMLAPAAARTAISPAPSGALRRGVA